MGHRDLSITNVFLIHPHPYVAWGLERLIGSRQPTMQLVGSAKTCAEALERLDGCSADVILFDLDIESDRGSREIPTLLERTNAKILVLTGTRDESVHRKVMVAGASGVIRKERPVESILCAIEKVSEGQIWLDRASLGQLFSDLCWARERDDPTQAKIAALTQRENEVVALVAHHPGAGGKQLAAMLNISERTLRNHLSSIYEKLEISNRVEMYAFAHQNGLVPPNPERGAASHA